MTAIIDYGVGNLFSLRSSFAAIGEDAEVTADPERIRSADRVILPGVGAFEDAARKLRESGLDEVVREEAAKGKPLLGICLGMQMLFERSYEYGEHPGLGLLRGVIRPMAGRIPENLKIPQMGWNDLKIKKESPLLKYTHEGDYVYFVHSFSRGGMRRVPAGHGGVRRRDYRMRWQGQRVWLPVPSGKEQQYGTADPAGLL